LYNKAFILIFFFSVTCQSHTPAQCLSSFTPVGGTENLLVLQKKAFRVITFYKHGGGNQYFNENRHADYDLIGKACYNNLTSILGYGITDRLSIESELGYFINKSQKYNTQPAYTLKGHGFSNLVLSVKYGLYNDHFNRVFYSAGLGIKIPCSVNPQLVNNVELPVELQPTIGACGMVFNSVFVKENTGRGLRYFLTNRLETSLTNKNDYRLGAAIFNSMYVSKHLMFSWLKGDWTAIMQLRNEIRLHDKIAGDPKMASGSVLFFAVPQVNYVVKEKWYLSTMLDIPLYQYFNGTQLGAGMGITVSLSRTFHAGHQKADAGKE
jgi:hypothetical protein